jgi:CSLREA domain-containing protein
VFPTVFSVNQSGDTDDGSCDATCTLRTAINRANATTASQRPVLIRFDHGAFAGGNAQIQITNNSALQITAPGTVVDGIDPAGRPSPLEDFPGRQYRTLIAQQAPTSGGTSSSSCVAGGQCNLSPAGKILVSAANVQLIGLSITRTLAPDAELCCGDTDVVTFGTSSAGSRLQTSRLDGGAAARTNAEGSDESSTSTPPQGKDCVDVDSTGGTQSNPVMVDNCEIRFCFDRGVKSKSGHLKVQSNWIHHNLRGGLFAQNPNGVIEAVGNLVEQNGRDCPTADTQACGTQVDARTDASEMSAQGGTTKLITNGNVLRDGVLHGLFFQSDSQGQVRNDYICRMNGVNDDRNGKGILIEKLTGTASQIVVRGTTVAYNNDAGAKFEKNIDADFGTDGGANAGLNAFAWNGDFIDTALRTKRNFRAVEDVPLVDALGNYWQNCYPASNPNENQCSDTNVSNLDTNNDNNNPFNRVDNRNAKPHAADQATQGTAILDIDGDGRAVTPSKAVQGQIVRIEGKGFNAIGGHNASYDCHMLTDNNCNGPNGTCVEFESGPGQWERATILGVTPTHIVVRSPITCAKPTRVRVRRKRLGGEEVKFEPLPDQTNFCRN